MVLHDQGVDISSHISTFERKISALGYKQHAIHTGPLIRRESNYLNDDWELRKYLFKALFYFTHKLDISYISTIVNKYECGDEISLSAKLSASIVTELKRHDDFFKKYDRIIVYYDNGQSALTRILSTVFTLNFFNIEIRKVCPSDYKLFQVADLICTTELLSVKAEKNMFSKSEMGFFGSAKIFKKDYLRAIRKKKL